jgi:hypothetical protein
MIHSYPFNNQGYQQQVGTKIRELETEKEDYIKKSLRA